MKSKRYEQKSFSEIVKNSRNLTEIAENLDLKPFCGNRNTIKKFINLYNLDTSHFRIRYENREKRKGRDIDEILVTGSTFNTTKLKQKLYKEGLKQPICEKCGQDEIWNGEHMSLILDHISGNNTDNRIENLRIVCPNCNATLPTHGGKNRKNFIFHSKPTINKCKKCGENIDISAKLCKTCSNLGQRNVKRPPYEQLKKEIEDTSYCAVGRKYGVSDNAIRKWIKFYEKYNTLLSGHT